MASSSYASMIMTETGFASTATVVSLVSQTMMGVKHGEAGYQGHQAGPLGPDTLQWQ